MLHFLYFTHIILGGIFYAPKMRREGYVIMFDPFQLKYGRKIGGLLFLPQFLGDLFWSASVMAALGKIGVLERYLPIYIYIYINESLNRFGFYIISKLLYL